MKFSIQKIREMAPFVKSAEDVRERLTTHLFEVEDIVGDTIDIKILPNRYDAASYLGLTRELYAAAGKRWKEKKLTKVRVVKKGSVKAVIQTKKCARCMTVYMEGVRISPSPKWLQDVLLHSGMRPINNVVDVTNYVTLMTGQPLHAFDFQKMEGKQIVVREAKQGEEVKLLTGEQIFFQKGELMLADTRGALDLAGIKGGERAEINAETEDIVLTATNFDGTTVRETARRVGVITDASSRFAHGLSAELVGVGMEMAINLLIKITGAKLGKTFDAYPKKALAKKIVFDPDRILEILGVEITPKEMKKILQDAGFGFSGKQIIVPSVRTDIETIEDVAEEVGRIYGYNNFSLISPQVYLFSNEEEGLHMLERVVRERLIATSYQEIKTHSFVSEREAEETGNWGVIGDEGEAVKIENPTAALYARGRKTLITLGKEVVKRAAKDFSQVRMFEIGNVYVKNIGKVKEETVATFFSSSREREGIREVKGVLQAIIKNISPSSLIEEQKDDKLFLSLQGKVVGVVGHAEGVAYGEISLTRLLSFISFEKKYEAESVYPVTFRDISFSLSREVSFGELESEMIKAGRELLSDFYQRDEYKKEGKSIFTYRMYFQSKEKTLTNEEVDGRMSDIIRSLSKNGVEIF